MVVRFVIHKLALSLYVLGSTGSAAIFAGLLSIATIPTILLSPLGGVLADRANRRNIMIGLDLLSGVTALGAFLLFNESYAIPLIGGANSQNCAIKEFRQKFLPRCIVGDTFHFGRV